MYGLALIAAELAWRRAYGKNSVLPFGEWLPANPREVIDNASASVGGASREYYAICDRVTRGENP